MTSPHIRLDLHPISEPKYQHQCRFILEKEGALVLKDFFSESSVREVVQASSGREAEAFYANSTHNVYLTPVNQELPETHPFNRQVLSSKGLLADDQIPKNSPLRELYEAPSFREFLCSVLGIREIHPYADNLSSINIHFAQEGKELGWHFDNSSFAVTMLLQAPEAGGEFEYVPEVRDAETGEMGFDQVDQILSGRFPVQKLFFDPGDLVLFRGRNSIHRVTPTEGKITRMLVVFAFNDQPGIGLSESALKTFYGRKG